MKIIITIVFLMSLISCSGQNKKSLSTDTNNDSIMKVKEVSKIPMDAFQINLNFDDNPVWFWVKYDHNLSWNNTIYNHIYGINYWDEEGVVKTLYYEKDREDRKTDSIDFSNYIIKPYPGDNTIQLINKVSDTLLLFNVLENKTLSSNLNGKEYQRIPTVDINTKNQKVSHYDVRINCILIENSLYEVTIINDDGINAFIFRSNCIIKDELVISYYDLTNDRIYLLVKDCYLEKTDL